jgi:RNA polymerase sigma factor (sigma-70 family)
MAEPVRPPHDGAEDPLLRAYFEKRANLVRFFAAKAGSPAAAEDLAQDLYLKLAARGPETDVQSPTALLYRMATNLMLDKARGERRSAARDTAWRTATRSSIAGEDVAQEPPADEAAASRQRLRQLVAAAEELPPQMRRAFRLHKLEGLSHAQTAQAMGISVKAVEKHISAALKALTRKLTP